MKKHVFYDTDITGQEEYDIKGEEYRKLIQFYSNHCPYFSLLKTVPEDPVSLALEKYAISRPNVCPEPPKRYTYLQLKFQPYDIFYPVYERIYFSSYAIEFGLFVILGGKMYFCTGSYFLSIGRKYTFFINYACGKLYFIDKGIGRARFGSE